MENYTQRPLRFLMRCRFGKCSPCLGLLRNSSPKPLPLNARSRVHPYFLLKDGAQRIRSASDGKASLLSRSLIPFGHFAELSRAFSVRGCVYLVPRRLLSISAEVSEQCFEADGQGGKGNGSTKPGNEVGTPLKWLNQKMSDAKNDKDVVETLPPKDDMRTSQVVGGLSPLTLASQNPNAKAKDLELADKVPSSVLVCESQKAETPGAASQDTGQVAQAVLSDQSQLLSAQTQDFGADYSGMDVIEPTPVSEKKIEVPPEMLDASALFQEMSSISKLVDFPGPERLQLKEILRRFADRGWARNQALAIYINSKSFPRAASRFHKFFVPRCPSRVRHLLLAMGPSDQAEEFLFPIFAEFCIHELSPEIARYRELVNSADLTKPHMWFPFARAMKRKIVYHCGPTNSGKTYNALQRFMKASTGIYCCPLRLLAMEIYEKVNVMGVYCSLHTGQEKRDVPFATHLACTVEMAQLGKQWEVAVVDEVQMMNDEFRGWAWTRALLALQAEEIHVCGDPSALKLLRSLCAATGDEIEVQDYERFIPLKIDSNSLRGDFSKIRAGDCVVAFSRREIFQVKQEIEITTNHRCCVIYGALPPETRTQQAKLFNDPNSGFDVLVASDAIGMGLNLNIRRVIFYAMEKFNGDQKSQVPPSHIKQIAGRAGRRGSRYPEGIATTFYSQDIAYLTNCMNQPFQEAESAGLFPVFEQMELFASQLPDISFAQLLDRFAQTCRLDGSYFLCRHDHLKKVAHSLDKISGLSLEDRFYFCFAPVNFRDPKCMGTLFRFATAYSRNVPVRMFIGLPKGTAKDDMQLCNLETQHQLLSMYLWLGHHFPENAFPQKVQAAQMASEIAVLLGESLQRFSSHTSQKQQQAKGQNTDHSSDRAVESKRRNDRTSARSMKIAA